MHPSVTSDALSLSPSKIQKLLNRYLVADYEQPISGEIMESVACVARVMYFY